MIGYKLFARIMLADINVGFKGKCAWIVKKLHCFEILCRRSALALVDKWILYIFALKCKSSLLLAPVSA